MFTFLPLATLALLSGTVIAADKNNSSFKIANQTMAPGKVIKNGKLLYTEIRIEAPAAKVWSILLDFEKYPEWNPFIKEISGTPSVGSRIHAHIVPPGNKGMDFTPEILVNEPNRELRWIGKLGISYLFDGEHTFAITDNGDGSCTFRHYERFRGILVPFFGKMLDEGTKLGFEEMNRKLKERAEK